MAHKRVWLQVSDRLPEPVLRVCVLTAQDGFLQTVIVSSSNGSRLSELSCSGSLSARHYGGSAETGRQQDGVHAVLPEWLAQLELCG